MKIGRRSILLHLALLMVLSGICSFFGLALSYQKDATPRSAWGLFSKIHMVDGWIQDGSSINPEHLASRGNRMLLKFNAWRPPGQDPAHLRIHLCDKPYSEVVVSENLTETVYLSDACEPRRVSFEVVNPFMASETDKRQLGAQLISMQITSKLGLPILQPSLILQVTLAVFLLGLMVYMALSVVNAPASLALLVPFCSYYLLEKAKWVNLMKPYPLWLLAVSLAIGVFLYGAFVKKGMAEDSEQQRDAGSGLTLYSWLGLLIVGVGASLRFYGIGFGLPSNFHPDEVPKVNAVMRMVQQDTLNPQYFLHPSLLLYSTYFMNTLFHFFGMEGEFRDTAFLAGRTVSALGGSLSIYFLYVIGRRLYSPSVGLFAAAFLAVMPLHVTCSRYLKEDALLLTFILAATVAMLKAVQEDRRGFLMLAGLLAGCSLSTKYSGLLTAGIVGLAPWIRSRSLIPDRRYIIPTACALALVPIGFIMCTPYSILDSTRFLKDFNSERHHMTRGHTIRIDAWSQFWMYHFWRSVVPGVSFFGTLLSMVGVGILLWRRRVEDLFLVGMILLFYLPAEFVKAKPAPQPERYILPCLPFIAVAGAELLRALSRTRVRFAVPVLALALLIPPALRTTELAGEIGDDTRDKMARWMIENLPPGSKIYFDWKPYGPRFFNDEFEVTYVPRAHIVSKLGIDALKRSGQEYLVLSSLWYGRYFTQPRSDAVVKRRIRDLFQKVPIVKEFRPVGGTYGFHNPTVTLFTLDKQAFAALEQELREQRSGERMQTSNEMRASFRW